MIWVAVGIALLLLGAFTWWRFHEQLLPLIDKASLAVGAIVGVFVFLAFAISKLLRPLPPPPSLPKGAGTNDDEAAGVEGAKKVLKERLHEFEEAKTLPADDKDRWLSDRLNRKGHVSVPALIGLSIVLILVGLLGLAMGGCAPKTPPEVFAKPIPEYPAPELVEAPEFDRPCPAAAPLTPGKAPPYTEGGLATCRAQIVPPERAWDLLQAEESVRYYEDLLATCTEARERDRVACQDSYDIVWTDDREIRQEFRVQRVVTVGLVVLSLLAGYALGRLP